MCVCVCVYAYACMRICVCVHAYMCVWGWAIQACMRLVYIQVCVHAHVCMLRHVRVRACMSTCALARTRARAFVRLCILTNTLLDKSQKTEGEDSCLDTYPTLSILNYVPGAFLIIHGNRKHLLAFQLGGALVVSIPIVVGIIFCLILCLRRKSSRKLNLNSSSVQI